MNFEPGLSCRRRSSARALCGTTSSCAVSRAASRTSPRFAENTVSSVWQRPGGENPFFRFRFRFRFFSLLFFRLTDLETPGVSKLLAYRLADLRRVCRIVESIDYARRVDLGQFREALWCVGLRRVRKLFRCFRKLFRCPKDTLDQCRFGAGAWPSSATEPRRSWTASRARRRRSRRRLKSHLGSFFPGRIKSGGELCEDAHRVGTRWYRNSFLSLSLRS